MTVATITSKGQVTIPADIRKQLHLEPGDKVDFQFEESGTARLLPLSRKTNEVFGILANKTRGPVSSEEMDKKLRDKFRGSKR